MLAGAPLVSALLLASVTLGPARQESLKAAQRFLDQTSEAYDVRKATLVLGEPGIEATAAIDRDGLITIRDELLDHPEFRDIVLSHEMAHLILGHADRRPNSLDERQQREIDADVQGLGSNELRFGCDA